MKLIEVNDKTTVRAFLRFPVRLYKGEKTWIRPLDSDIEQVFDPGKNKFFRHGECIRWVLQNDKQETIGRVAAFINKKTAQKEEQPTGGMGFFECIEDKNAAFQLFDACKSWLQAKGMEAMDGPVNFGDRDRWWGLLIDGFHIEPNYCCNYNFPYYQQFFEEYGFQIYFKQFTYGRKTRDPFHPKIAMKAEKVAQDPNYRFEHLKKSNLKKYTEDFRTVYNKAWSRHKGVAEMSSLQAKNAMKKIKPIMDDKIIWYGYYNDEPIEIGRAHV